MAIDGKSIDLSALGIRTTDDAAAKATGGKKSLGQEDFLKLMITQFQQQDPFKPMENGEFLGQMAQFSSVAGLEDLKKSFADLSTSLVSNQTLQASSLLGRKVLVDSDKAAITQGDTVNAAVELTGSAQSLQVQILNSKGEIVRKMNLGAQSEGRIGFTWDGKLEDGTSAPTGLYTINAQAVNGPKSQEAMKTLVEDSVQSVTMGANSAGLLLSLPKLGDVLLTDVRQIS